MLRQEQPPGASAPVDVYGVCRQSSEDRKEQTGVWTGEWEDRGWVTHGRGWLSVRTMPRTLPRGGGGISTRRSERKTPPKPRKTRGSSGASDGKRADEFPPCAGAIALDLLHYKKKCREQIPCCYPGDGRGEGRNDCAVALICGRKNRVRTGDGVIGRTLETT